MKAKGSITNLEIHNTVEMEWLDTHSTGRIPCAEIKESNVPRPTGAYGIVFKNGNEYLMIANKIRLDYISDGSWVGQISHGAIWEIRKLGRRNSDLRGE